jgi:SAM-dependent methyltransferase
MTEHDKWRHIVAPELWGNGIELATGGDPLRPTSIQFELTEKTYAHYNNNQPLRGLVHWRQDDAIFYLPFKDGVLDYVFSSHLIEDFLNWEELLREWTRVLKVGGRLVICAPERDRWNKAVANGQCPNCSHRREPLLGELTAEVKRLKLPVLVLEERLTDSPVGDYNILFIAVKL